MNGTDIDPFQVDRKANNYIIHNASKLVANNIGTEKFGNHRSYAMSYMEHADLFLRLFKWFRDFRRLMSENAISPSSQVLLTMKAYLSNIRCKLSPSVVKCVLNIPLDIAISILTPDMESSPQIKEAKCAFKRRGARCKMAAVIGGEGNTDNKYCSYHNPDKIATSNSNNVW